MFNEQDRKWLGEVHGKMLTPHNLPDGSDPDDMLGQLLTAAERVRDTQHAMSKQYGDLMSALGNVQERFDKVEQRLEKIELGGVSKEEIKKIAVEGVNEKLDN